MYMSVRLPVISVQHLHVYCPQRREEAIGSLGAEVTDGYEPPCGFWESNVSPGIMLLFAIIVIINYYYYYYPVPDFTL